MKKFSLDSELTWQGRSEVCHSISLCRIDELLHPDQIITSRKTITIVFHYPLGRNISFKFKSKDGFTKRRFMEAIYKGYKKIYTEEDRDEEWAETECFPECVLVNFKDEKAPYDIWGHCMGDLYIEGIREVKNGVFELSMGS